MAKEARRKKSKYTDDLPRAMYSFFVNYSDTGVPSFGKFAVSRGLTLEELMSFCSRKEFARAKRECEQIRKDALIDGALCKRLDPSTVKYLLSCEYGMDKDDSEKENDVSFRLEVVE